MKKVIREVRDEVVEKNLTMEVKEMTQERIKEIAKAFLQDFNEGYLFIAWDDIRNILKSEEDVNEETLEILTDNVLDEIERIASESGASCYYPGETYIYNTGYRSAKVGGITIVK